MRLLSPGRDRQAVSVLPRVSKVGGIERVRAQAEAVVAAASQPILLQVAQEASMKDMANRFQAMSERLMSDPDIRRSAEEMQQKLMSDPETRQLIEELMRRLGAQPEE